MHDLTRFGGVTQTEFHFWNYKQDEWCLILCTTYAFGTTTVFLWRRINFAVKPHESCITLLQLIILYYALHHNELFV
jgi:hypothetical protein